MQLLQMNFGNMEVWQWLFLAAVMIPMSIKDIKERQINGYICILAIMAVLVFRVTYLCERDIVMLVDIVPGLVLLFFSYLSMEEIGYGDGAMLVFVGCVVGFEKAIVAIMISFIVTMSVGLVSVIHRGGNRKREIPFVPFMSMGAFAGGFLL